MNRHWNLANPFSIEVILPAVELIYFLLPAGLMLFYKVWMGGPEKNSDFLVLTALRFRFGGVPGNSEPNLAQSSFERIQLWMAFNLTGGVSDRQFQSNSFTEMCSGSEAGSRSRPIDFYTTQPQA